MLIALLKAVAYMDEENLRLLPTIHEQGETLKYGFASINYKEFSQQIKFPEFAEKLFTGDYNLNPRFIETIFQKNETELISLTKKIEKTNEKEHFNEKKHFKVFDIKEEYEKVLRGYLQKYNFELIENYTFENHPQMNVQAWKFK